MLLVRLRYSVRLPCWAGRSIAPERRPPAIRPAADIVPVSEGLAYPSTAQRLPYGCHNLAQYLLQQLNTRGLNVSSLTSSSTSSGSSSSSGGSYADPAAVALDSLARSVACVAGGGDAAALAAAAGEPSTHTLPDGQQITIQREGAQLGEALMDGALLGADVSRLSEAVWTAAVAHTDQASRKVRRAGAVVCSVLAGMPSCWLSDAASLRMQDVARHAVGSAVSSSPLPAAHPLQCAAVAGGNDGVRRRQQHPRAGCPPAARDAGPRAPEYRAWHLRRAGAQKCGRCWGRVHAGLIPHTGLSSPACLLPDCMPEFRTTQAHAAAPGNATYTATPAASSVACFFRPCLAQDYMPEATLRHAAWMGGAVLARVSFSQVRACFKGLISMVGCPAALCAEC